MMWTMWILLWISVVITGHSASGQTPPANQVHFLSKNLTDIGKFNVKRTGTTIWKREDVSLVGCSELCVHKTNCAAFNYRIDIQTCELLTAGPWSELNETDSLSVTDLSWTNVLDGENVQKCSSKPCSSIAFCVDVTQSDPYCLIQYCDLPVKREGMSVTETDGRIGSTAQYVCDSYYHINYKFSSTFTCMADGTWSSVSFYCKCGEPRTISRASRSGNGRRVGERVTYSCNTNLYKESGYRYSTCQANGQWSSTSFRCLDGWYCVSCEIAGHVYTGGRNNNYPGCHSCHCCKKR